MSVKDFLKQKEIKDTLFINNEWIKDGLSNLLDEYNKELKEENDSLNNQLEERNLSIEAIEHYNDTVLSFQKQLIEKDEEIKEMIEQIDYLKGSTEGFKALYIADCKENNYNKSILNNYQKSHNAIMELNKVLQSEKQEILNSLKKCLEGVEELNNEHQSGWDFIIEEANNIINKNK